MDIIFNGFATEGKFKTLLSQCMMLKDQVKEARELTKLVEKHKKVGNRTEAKRILKIVPFICC